MPVTVAAGPDQILAEPAGADERGTGKDLRQFAELLVGVGGARPFLAAEARDRNVAVLVVEAGEGADHREQRVWRRPAELAAVLRPGEGRCLDRDHRHSPQRDRQRGHTGADTSHVADHHRVGGEELGLRRRVGAEGAADLLHPLDHDPDPHGRLAVPRPERPDVHEDVRLRVRGAASVDGPVALRRLERRRLPLGLVADGHDVVVAVQENRRGSGRSGDLADHDRRRARQLERVEDRDAYVAAELADRLVRLQ